MSLLWSRRTHRAAVVLYDDETGQRVELEILTGENPLDLYYHPYVYLPTRGLPGKRTDLPTNPGLATA